jgi:hypothetical protein
LDSSFGTNVHAADQDHASGGGLPPQAEFTEILVRCDENPSFARRPLQDFLVGAGRLNLRTVRYIVPEASKEGDDLRLDILVGVEFHRLPSARGM